jgi:hypothetical protein
MNDNDRLDAVRGQSALTARPTNAARVARSLKLSGAARGCRPLVKVERLCLSPFTRGAAQLAPRWALSCCPNGLTLKTLVENFESRAFYKSLGMSEKGRSVNDFSGREEIEYAL